MKNQNLMRLNKMGWVSAITLGGLLAVQSLAQAQEKKDPQPAVPATPATPAVPGAPGATPAAPLNPQELRARRADAQLKSMTRMLTLSEEQQGKIKPILEEQFKKYEELQQDKNVPIEERRVVAAFRLASLSASRSQVRGDKSPAESLDVWPLS